MEPDELLATIRLGESETVEFKSSIGNDRSVAQSMSALANAHGGIIVFGVADDRTLRGLRPGEAERGVRRIARVAIEMFDRLPTIQQISIDNKDVVVAEIPHTNDVVMTADGSIFRRAGDADMRVERPTPRDRPSRTSSTVRVFVAMSFRFEEEPALVDYFEAIRRAVSRLGFPVDIRRIDLLDGDFEIMQQTEAEIERADFVITDYTLNSQNVFYEAGIAKGLGKPMIRCARRGTVLPFDVRQYRTYFYSNATQLEEQLVPALEEMLE